MGPRGDWVGGTQASKHPPRMGFLLHVCRNEAPLAPQSLLGGRRGRPGRGSPLPTSWGSGPGRPGGLRSGRRSGSTVVLDTPKARFFLSLAWPFS